MTKGCVRRRKQCISNIMFDDNTITSVSNNDINIIANGTGNIYIGSMCWPSVQGDFGQLLSPTSSGHLEFSSANNMYDYYMKFGATNGNGTITRPYGTHQEVIDNVPLDGIIYNVLIIGFEIITTPILLPKNIKVALYYKNSSSGVGYATFLPTNGDIFSQLDLTGTSGEYFFMGGKFANCGGYAINIKSGHRVQVSSFRLYYCGWNGTGVNVNAIAADGNIGYDSTQSEIQTFFASNNVSDGGAIDIQNTKIVDIRDNIILRCYNGIRCINCGIISTKLVDNKIANCLGVAACFMGSTNDELTGTVKMIMRNNVIVRICSIGLIIIGGDDNYIVNNFIEDTWDSCIVLQHISNTTLLSNVINRSNRSLYNISGTLVKDDGAIVLRGNGYRETSDYICKMLNNTIDDNAPLHNGILLSSTLTGCDVHTATEGQTIFNTDVTWHKYTLNVYLNDLIQINDVDYTETTTNSITFTNGLTIGDIVTLSVEVTRESEFIDIVNQRLINHMCDIKAEKGSLTNQETGVVINRLLLHDNIHLKTADCPFKNEDNGYHIEYPFGNVYTSGHKWDFSNKNKNTVTIAPNGNTYSLDVLHASVTTCNKIKISELQFDNERILIDDISSNSVTLNGLSPNSNDTNNIVNEINEILHGTSIGGPPIITSSNMISGIALSALNYTITADNWPLFFNMSNNPSTFNINQSTGQILGTLPISGNSTFTVSSSNIYGTSSQLVDIISTSDWSNGKSTRFYKNQFNYCENNLYVPSYLDGFTISFWYRRQSTAAGRIMSFGNVDILPANKSGFELLYGGNNLAFIWGRMNGSTSRVIGVAVGAIIDSDWHHIIITKDQGPNIDLSSFNIYVDNVSLTLIHYFSTHLPDNGTDYFYTTNLKTRIGCDLGTTNFVDMNIDEFTIWNKALNTSQRDDLSDINGYPIDIRNGHSEFANCTMYLRTGDQDIYPVLTDNSNNTNDMVMINMISANILNDFPH